MMSEPQFSADFVTTKPNTILGISNTNSTSTNTISTVSDSISDTVSPALC